MRTACAAGIAVAALACGGSAPAPDTQGAGAAPPPEAEAPVALNPDLPIAYPPALFEDRIEGDVVLRMFVDTAGRLVPESTRVAESSNYSALDSAALAGSAKLRFAPAKRRGVPVATAFLQPVEFRYLGAGAARGATAPASQPRPLPVAPRPRVVVPPLPLPPRGARRYRHRTDRHDQAEGPVRHDPGPTGHQCRRTLSPTPTSSRRSAGRR